MLTTRQAAKLEFGDDFEDGDGIAVWVVQGWVADGGAGADDFFSMSTVPPLSVCAISSTDVNITTFAAVAGLIVPVCGV